MKIALAALLLSLPALAEPLTLEADPAHSTASFSVKHMMVTTVRGEFGKVASTLQWDRKDPAKSSVDVTIDAASIDTHNEKRDAHLKSPDFFDVQKCPEIIFKSKKIRKEGGDKYKVTGDLTLHCVTKPVTVNVTFNPNGMKTPWGPTVYAAQGTAKIKRSDFGLTWNKTLDSGGVLVSDDANLEVDLEYSQQPAATASESKTESKTK